MVHSVEVRYAMAHFLMVHCVVAVNNLAFHDVVLTVVAAHLGSDLGGQYLAFQYVADARKCVVAAHRFEAADAHKCVVAAHRFDVADAHKCVAAAHRSDVAGVRKYVVAASRLFLVDCRKSVLVGQHVA